MAHHRAASKGQGTSSGLRSREGSLSARESEDDDYPLDGLAPDDLPTRDVRGDEESWHPPDEAEAEALGRFGLGPANPRAVEADSFGPIGIASETAPSSAIIYECEPTPDASSPLQRVRIEAAEPPAQWVLPGLEPDALPTQIPTPKRPRRPRGPSNKRILRAAQIGLWPKPEIPGSET